MAIQRLALPLGGGVNVFDDPVAIPDGQWQRLRNLATRKTGIVGQRPALKFTREVIPSWWHWDGRTLAGELGVAASVEDYWRWAENLRPVKFLFDPNFGQITMICITTATYSVIDESAPGVQTARAVAEGTMLLVTLPGVITGNGSGAVPSLRCSVLGQATLQPSMFVFNGVTYAFAGQNNGAHVSSETYAGNPVAFTYARNNFGAGNTDFHPQGACVVRNRVVYFKGPNLYFSDRNDPLVVGYTGITDADGNIIPSTANPAVGTNYSALATRGIFLGGEELEDITAVAEVNTSADGSPVQSVAMAFTKTHAYMLLGEPLETTEGGDILGSLQINRLNVQAGCVSQATVARSPYGTFWCGKDDVWFMPFGSLPIRVGTSIRPLIEEQPDGLAWKLHAEYYDGFYRLSLFSPGQGPSLYDPCGMQMWLDLRRGAPRSAEEAQWFGPQEFVNTDAPTSDALAGGPAGVWCMAKDIRANGDQRLYALQSYVMPGMDDDTIKGMTLCDFDSFDGRDTCAPHYERQAWLPSHSYYEGDIIVPAQDAANPNLVYTCTQSGTSGSTEPTWSAPDANGHIFESVLRWTATYHNGSSPLSAYKDNAQQGDNQIEWSALAKEMMLGDPMVDKLLDGSELGYWAQDRTQVTQRTHVKQDTRSHVLGLASENVADNVESSTTGERVWQSAALTPSPTARFRGKSMTWECGQDAGIVITEGVNDTITITVAGVPHLLTIAAGFYDSIGTVGTAICTAAQAIGVAITTKYLLDSNVFSQPLFGFRSGSAGVTLAVTTNSRLANLFGYSTAQGATVSATNPTFTVGYESPRTKLAPDMQLSGINLRFKLFGRRPT